MKRKFWETVLITALTVVLLTGASLERTAESLSGKLVRLHVVANSDTEEDQALKLQVRDRVLEVLTERLEGVTRREEAEQLIREALPEVTRAAEETLQKAGHPASVEATLCEERFPTTDYETFSLPAGEYTSLRVRIGEAAGHNWWCVVFPPVCSAPSIESGAAAVIGLTEDEIALIKQDGTDTVVRFRLLEIWEKVKELFA